MWIFYFFFVGKVCVFWLTPTVWYTVRVWKYYLSCSIGLCVSSVCCISIGFGWSNCNAQEQTFYNIHSQLSFIKSEKKSQLVTFLIRRITSDLWAIACSLRHGYTVLLLMFDEPPQREFMVNLNFLGLICNSLVQSWYRFVIKWKAALHELICIVLKMFE